MKAYPSIRGSIGQKFQSMANAYIFDKLDGRNVRVEWTKKKGWHKWGTRHRLFDGTDSEYAPAIPLFNQIYAEPLAKIATNSKWQSVIVFLEFWQPSSLGGVFVPNESYNLTLFDAAPYKECQIGPKEFLNTFESKVPTVKFLGVTNFNLEFVQMVRNSELDGITMEGIVAKSGSQHSLDLAKAKTQKWIDAILARYGATEGQKLVES